MRPVPENTFPLTVVSSSVPAPATTADAIAREFAVLIDEHLAGLRARGVSEEILAPLESELQRYHQDKLAS